MKKQDKNRLSKKDKAAIKKALLEMAKKGFEKDLETTALALQVEFLKLNRTSGLVF
nr:MAG TPA: hypothetical protein [Caudoviricetes sp.]